MQIAIFSLRRSDLSRFETGAPDAYWWNRRTGHRAPRHRPARADFRAETRALIAIEAPTAADRSLSRTHHPAAPFLAQLIATQMRLPQTRARRRAEPEQAISAYGAHDAGGAAGRTFRRRA